MVELMSANEWINYLRDNPDIHWKYFGRPVVYHRRFKSIEDLFKDLNSNINRNKDSYDAYYFYKKELSHICGWDASRKNYNQDLYDRTILQIIDKLEV